MALWSHQPISADERLTGAPDYLLADGRPIKSQTLVNTPLLAVAEAKRQDFDEGWGQCLAAMLACQKLNGDRPVTVHGIVTTGINWEFGRLEADRFTQHPAGATIYDPDLALGMIDQLFAKCEASCRRCPEAAGRQAAPAG